MSRFWNTVWLVLVRTLPIEPCACHGGVLTLVSCAKVDLGADQQNDLLIGYTISSLISLNTSYIVHHLRTAIDLALVQWSLDALTWLDDWPVGLKLNTPLSHFYRTTLSAGISYWAGTSRLLSLLTFSIITRRTSTAWYACSCSSS